MPNQMIAIEMALAAQRERMLEIAKNRQLGELALAGRSEGQVRRAHTVLSALVQRAGRSFAKGTAPRHETKRNLEQSNLDRARLGNQSVSIARF